MENPPSTSDPRKCLVDLPLEVLELILDNIAKRDYHTLEVLARTCHKMQDLCKIFMKRNPASKYRTVVQRPAGLSDEEDSGSDDGWNYDMYDGDYCDENDLDELNDRLERISYGSNYDDDIDEYLNEQGNNEGPPPADIDGQVVDESGW